MLRTIHLKSFLLAGLLISANVFASGKKDQPAQASVASSEAKQSVEPKTPAGAPLSIVTCLPCHASDGNIESPTFPKLAGLSAEYILKQLREFKKGPNGHRNNAVMLTIANDLSEQDMNDLAVYYAKQVRTIGVASPTNIDLGRRIYRSGNSKTGVSACAACHLPDGSGNTLAGFPRLSGQSPEYISQQLQAFKSGDRSNDLNGIMQAVAARMSDEEIEAVSNYVSGLH